MKILSNKKILTIVLALILSISTLVAFQSVEARTPPKIFPTWTYVSVSPTIDGVGQSINIVFWCNFLPPTALGQYGDRWSFTVNVVKPDGTNDTLGPIGSDPVGSGYVGYTPTEVGQYEFQVVMAQHVIDGGASRGLVAPQGAGYWPSGQPNPAINPIGDIFLSSTSAPQNMTVQSTAIPKYVETPLPNDYWTRPVYDANRNWGPVILGEWLNAGELSQFGNNGRYNAFSTGPSSAHILWSTPYYNGGIAGGTASQGAAGVDASYYSGQSYESYGAQPYMVLNGKLYCTIQTPPREGWYQLDLVTGKEVYYANTTGAVLGVQTGQDSSGAIQIGLPAFGQLLDMETPNQHGVISYYWVTTTPGGTLVNVQQTSNVGSYSTATYTPIRWDMYDDYSNQYICSISPVTWTVTTPDKRTVTEGATGTSSVGLDGSILRYNIVNLGTTASPSVYLQIWNTTQAIMSVNDALNANQYWMWRPNLNWTYDGKQGFSFNSSVSSVANIGSIRQIIPENEIIGIYAGSNNGTYSVPGTVWALNLNATRGAIGSLLYSYNFTAPAGLGDAADQSEQFSPHDTAYSGVNAQAGIFWYVNSMNRVWFVYSLADGHLMWTSPQGPQFEFYGMGSVMIWDGMFIDCGGYGGVVQAYDVQTGTPVWNWTAPSVGQGETPYQNTPTSLGCLSGDGQLYLYSSEHSINDPIRRDGCIWDINATIGKELWQETCWPSGAPILADGDILVLDNHDNQIYNYGKGPSSTTVQAPMTGVNPGESLVICGSVLDTSVGTQQTGIAARFPTGVAAVSDASENAWMEYVYHQSSVPANTTGVPVSITAIDPNGNLVNIGAPTSDSSGMFTCTYTPTIAGSYTVFATFAGTSSNYPSYAESSFAVNNPAATPTPSPAAVVDLGPTQMYIISGIIATIVVIAIVGALIMMALKKRA